MSSSNQPSICVSMEVLCDMREKTLLCDLKLIGNDFIETHKYINAHAVVIAASCSYFYKSVILNKPPSKKDREVMVVDGIDSRTLEVVVDFIYGKIPINVFDQERLQKAATLLELKAAIYYLNTCSTVSTRKCDSDQMVHGKTISIKILSSYPCPFCFEKYTLQNELLDHLSLMHSDLGCLCPVCGVETSEMTKHVVDSHVKSNFSVTQKKAALVNTYKTDKLNGLVTITYPKCWEQFLTCIVCEKIFNEKSELNEHLLNQHSYVRCRFCCMVFQGKTFRHKHESSTHHQLKCSICIHSTFDSKLSLSNHILSEHQNKFNYICTICAGHCTKPMELSTHFLEFHEIKATYADLRNLDVLLTNFNKDFFLDVLQQRCELRSKWLKSIFPCNFCMKLFGNSYDLAKDIKYHLEKERQRLIHMDQNEYECSLCRKTFASLAKYQSHDNIVHNKRYVCTICKVICSSHSNLVSHSLKHSQNRPFGCNICGKTFKMKSTLATHQITHTDIRNFKCVFCGTTYKHRERLRQHISQVHDSSYVKRFVCDICGLKVHEKTTLKRHMLKHTGERKYECELCHKTYSTASHVSRHRKTYHHVQSTIQSTSVAGNNASVTVIDSQSLMGSGDLLATNDVILMNTYSDNTYIQNLHHTNKSSNADVQHSFIEIEETAQHTQGINNLQQPYIQQNASQPQLINQQQTNQEQYGHAYSNIETE